MKPLIRRARREDVPQLVCLLEDLFAIEQDFAADGGKQTAGLKMLLEVDHACLLVAEASGEVVGMCSGQLLVSTAEGGPVVLVEDVVVRPDRRGCGIGGRLLESLEKWARENNATRLQLLADRLNGDALGFYGRLGWDETSLFCLRKMI